MARNMLFSQLRNTFRTSNHVSPLFSAILSKYSNMSFHVQKPVENNEKYTKFDVSRDPEEWAHVERLLAPAIIPKPRLKPDYPSNWKPQNDDAVNNPFFVQRSKNHMIPVYLEITHRGMRKVSVIKRVQGDLFALEKEIKNHVEESLGRPVATQVNELVGTIKFKGDFVNIIKEFLLQKGF